MNPDKNKLLQLIALALAQPVECSGEGNEKQHSKNSSVISVSIQQSSRSLQSIDKSSFCEAVSMEETSNYAVTNISAVFNRHHDGKK